MKIQHIKLTLLLLSVLTPMLLVVVTNDVSAQGLNVPEPTTEQYTGGLEGNPILGWIEFFINVLSVVIVAGSAVMIAFAGVQYSAARDNPQQVQAAKQRMWNVGIGLIAYFFLYGFVQWIIPGGVF